MQLAFYAPLKPPDHEVPSGDRQMARALVRALTLAGFDVEVASGLRTYRKRPDIAALETEAEAERRRLLDHWQGASKPRLWLTYHPYYRAPDLIGPAISKALSIPYVTVEASHAGKRDLDEWRAMQAPVAEAVCRADLNICLTQTDREGLERIVRREQLADLPPFIDVQPFRSLGSRSERGDPVRLITVAMMRHDTKLDSYRVLAEALKRISVLPWRLTIVGDGMARKEVESAFAGIDAGRLEWLGQLTADRVVETLSGSDLFVWPGLGEAYGLAYLEAQAAGLPVVAMETHGVPMVVCDGQTGILAPAGDIGSYAGAIAELVSDHGRRSALGRAARAFTLGERSLEGAANRLSSLLKPLVAVPA